jgi:hypothetical protein
MKKDIPGAKNSFVTRFTLLVAVSIFLICGLSTISNISTLAGETPLKITLPGTGEPKKDGFSIENLTNCTLIPKSSPEYNPESSQCKYNKPE